MKGWSGTVSGSKLESLELETMRFAPAKATDGTTANPPETVQ